MKNPTLYKKISTVDVQNRTTQQLSAGEVTQVNETVNKFFELFKIKHLS
jgi:hypothetical protein